MILTTCLCDSCGNEIPAKNSTSFHLSLKLQRPPGLGIEIPAQVLAMGPAAVIVSVQTEDLQNHLCWDCQRYALRLGLSAIGHRSVDGVQTPESST